MVLRKGALLALVLCAACSTSPGSDADADAGVSNDAGGPEAIAIDGGGRSEGAAGEPEADTDAASPAFEGTMALYELAGASSTVLRAFVSFHPPASHDYDDRVGPVGCTADHFDAQTKPAPPDANAGLLRISGFVGGKTLSNDPAQNPIGCMRPNAYYACAYPAGAPAADAEFAIDAGPIVPGPIAFAGNGGSDFQAFYVSGSPDDGTLTVQEDLAALHYDPTQDTILHATCTSPCTSARIVVELIAFSASSAASGWPYPSVGVLRCVATPAAQIALPRAAIAAALGSDSRLDTMTTSVVRLPGSSLQTRDKNGNALVADVGRGVFGSGPR